MGAGGGDNSPASQPKNNKITVSGTAVDELILNGKVKVHKPDTALLTEGRTSAANGTYTLTVTNYTGPVVVNVTCDTDSLLLIGTTEKTCPDNLNLNSVANVDGTEVTVNISPLTEIIYQRAVNLGSGKITEDSVTQASNQIATIFGVDPVRNNPTTGAYTAIIKAFHAVAEADLERDLFDVIADFAEDANDGVVDNSAALIDALKESGVTNPLTISEDASYVIPGNPASTEDVAQVKAMVKDLRTQATTITSYAKNEAEAMGTALSSVALDVQTVSGYIIRTTDLVVQAIKDGNTTLSGYIEVKLDGEWIPMGVSITRSTANPNEWTYSTVEGDYTGTISIPEITDDMEYTFTSLNAAFNGTLPYVDNIFTETENIQTQNVTLNLALTKTAEGADVTLSDFTIENSGDKISIDSLTGSISYTAPSDATEDPVFNYVKLDAITLSAIAGDYTATGTLSVPEYAVNTSLVDRGGVQDLPTTSAQLHIYCSAGISNTNAILSIDGKDYTYITHYAETNNINMYITDISGNFTQEQIEAGTQVNASCNDSSAPNINISTWYSSEELIGNSGFIPKKIAFEGSLKNTTTNGELSGSVDVELLNATALNLTTDGENIEDEIALKVDLSGKFVIPQRPDTLVNMSYETKVDDAANRHSVTGSYAHDTTLLTVDGSVDKTAENAQLTFTDGAGVVAKFILANDSFISGNAVASTGSLVTKDGRIVATIEERGEDIIIIKYLDGSLESIF